MRVPHEMVIPPFSMACFIGNAFHVKSGKTGDKPVCMCIKDI
jgi:hypothetical protein